MPAVSRHLRLLKQGGLGADRAEGTRRFYRPQEDGIAAVREYVESIWGEAAARFRLVAENTHAGGAMTGPLELEFAVACSPEHAFEVWTEKTSLSWPRGHSVSGHPELTVVLEPWSGGRIYVRTPVGVEHDRVEA